MSNSITMIIVNESKKTYYIADIEHKEIHDKHCTKAECQGVNTLVLEEANDAEIFLDKLGFEVCSSCQPHVQKIEGDVTV